MDNYEIPYTNDELKSNNYIDNYNFLKSLEKKVLTHKVFNHTFLKKFGSNTYTDDGVIFVMKQFGKIVMPFTAAICKLMGSSPDIKSRFMLMDNLYEEMGSKHFNQSHPILYLEMLNSMGISQMELETTSTISSIRILNNTIMDAVENKSFAIGCAWLGYGGELTIPNNFPYLVKGINEAKIDNINMKFWERHGSIDKEHSDDATTVLCMNTNEKEYIYLRESVIDSLNLRKAIWDELEEICDEKYQNISVINGKEKKVLPPEYQALHEYYSALSTGDIAKMKNNWSKETTTSFTSPLGGIVRTYEEVMASHEELFNIPIKIDVEYYDIEITILKNGFSSVGRERGTLIVDGVCIEVGFRTSRLFIKEKGIYKQLHHHGSFEDLGVQEKIMQLLGKLAA